jgi:hypothetical protein
VQGKRIWESQFRLERMAPFLSTYAQATANQRRRTRAFAKRCCRTPGTRDIPPVCDRYYTASAVGRSSSHRPAASEGTPYDGWERSALRARERVSYAPAGRDFPNAFALSPCVGVSVGSSYSRWGEPWGAITPATRSPRSPD